MMHGLSIILLTLVGFAVLPAVEQDVANDPDRQLDAGGHFITPIAADPHIATGPSIANAQPVARNMSVTVTEGRQVNIYLDVSDDSMSMTSLECRIVDGPTHGSLEYMYPDYYPQYSYAVRYQAPMGFSGSDTFTYTASNGTSVSELATVSITILEQLPPVAYDGTCLVALGIEPSRNAARVEDPNNDYVTCSVVDQPQHGSVAFSQGCYFLYEPEAGFSGDDHFTYRGDDGTGMSNEATITVRVRDLGDRDAIGELIVEIAMAELNRGFYDVGKDLDYYPDALADNMAKSAWCSEFVSWAYKAGGDPMTGGGLGGWMKWGYSSVRRYFEDHRRFIARGDPEWDSFTPRPGDYIWWDGHSGMVATVDGDTITTIEGNVGDKVRSRTFSPWRSKLPGIGIRNPGQRRTVSLQTVAGVYWEALAPFDAQVSTDADLVHVQYWSMSSAHLVLVPTTTQ